MHDRDRQIQYDLDLIVVKHLFRSTRFRHAKSLGLGLGALGHEVGTRHDLDVVEHGPVLQVDAADLAAADDSYVYRLFADGRILPLLGIRLQVSAFLPVA
jgi:hypothetical protein